MSVKPRLSVLDRRFKYRRSEHTDVRETWRRARRREQLLARLAKKAEKKPSADVVQLKKAGGA